MLQSSLCWQRVERDGGGDCQKLPPQQGRTLPKSTNFVVAAVETPSALSAWQPQLLGGVALPGPTYGTDLPQHRWSTAPFAKSLRASIQQDSDYSPYHFHPETPTECNDQPQIAQMTPSPCLSLRTLVQNPFISPPCSAFTTPLGQMAKDKLLPLLPRSHLFKNPQPVNPHTSELLGCCCSLGMLSVRAGFD